MWKRGGKKDPSTKKPRLAANARCLDRHGGIREVFAATSRYERGACRTRNKLRVPRLSCCFPVAVLKSVHLAELEAFKPRGRKTTYDGHRPNTGKGNEFQKEGMIGHLTGSTVAGQRKRKEEKSQTRPGSGTNWHRKCGRLKKGSSPERNTEIYFTEGI